MRKISLLRLGLASAALAWASTASATPYTISYGGDATPDSPTYGPDFTTIVFSGTGWSSDGNILTMGTGPGLGIWFGRGSGYGDEPSFSMASNTLGNKVEARVALGGGSTEWSLYWYDADGYVSAFEFLSNGYTYYTAAGTQFVANSDMTSLHTFASEMQGGQIAYYFDGALIGSGAATQTGFTNFLLIGDGSASTPTGTGSFQVDYLTINGESGPLSLPSSVPDSSATLLLVGAATAGLMALRRQRAPQA